MSSNNSALREKVRKCYANIVTEVDPNDVLDLLFRKRILDIDAKHRITGHKTKEERCRALIDYLLYCSNDDAFIVLREALVGCYPWIVKQIEDCEENDEVDSEVKRKQLIVRSQNTDKNESLVSELKPRQILDLKTPTQIVSIERETEAMSRRTSQEQHREDRRTVREIANSIRCGRLTNEVTAPMDFKIKSKATNVRIKELQNEANKQWTMNKELVKQNTPLNGSNDELRRKNNLPVGIHFQKDQDSHTRGSDKTTGQQLQGSVTYENTTIHQSTDKCNIEKTGRNQQIEGTPKSLSSDNRRKCGMTGRDSEPTYMDMKIKPLSNGTIRHQEHRKPGSEHTYINRPAIFLSKESLADKEPESTRTCSGCCRLEKTLELFTKTAEAKFLEIEGELNEIRKKQSCSPGTYDQKPGAPLPPAPSTAPPFPLHPSPLPLCPPPHFRSDSPGMSIHESDEDELLDLSRPQLLNRIGKSKGEIRGLAMLDNILYVARLGSMSIEMYDENDNFKRSERSILIFPIAEKIKVESVLLYAASTPSKRYPESSGIQDIACNDRTKRLFVSDWQNRCIHQVNPMRREIHQSWIVDAGKPWGISVTSVGDVLVCCPDSGRLCIYSEDGELLRHVDLKFAEDGPWYGLLLDNDNYVVCYGKQHERDYVGIADSGGNFVRVHSRPSNLNPSYLALFPNKKINRVLVTGSGYNDVVMLEQSPNGLQVRDLLRADDGLSTPVRLHYNELSGILFVGLSDGCILIYQMLHIGEQSKSSHRGSSVMYD